MTNPIISLDIETTGLDSENDAILEIGAVKFRDQRVEAEWETLINPGRRIPPAITQLTGITDAMVRDAPAIQDVLDELSDFIGNDPILGHNIKFDLSFLRRYRILSYNDALDTYEMAAVLLPNAGRYNLSALAQALGIILPATHRALDDARVTHAVYLRLMEEALYIPIDILEDIVRLSDNIEWHGYGGFFNALKERSQETILGSSNSINIYEYLLEAIPVHDPSALQSGEDLIPLEIEEVTSILDYGGQFSNFFPDYEYRHEQIEMLRWVAQALSHGQHLMVEAGTGVGKSFAYLIPAALWAIQNGRRVVISTNTINLQDQLINKDIPDLKDALGLDLRAIVLKGRANYLCPRRLKSLYQRGPNSAVEMRILGKVLLWLHGNTSGDRGDINLNGPAEREIWNKLSAADEVCTSETCVKRTGGVCPFYRTRQTAQNAHLIIVNHALLLADVATGNRVIPEYDHLIVDEAHHLESATTNALSFEVTQSYLLRILKELGGPKTGLLGRLLYLSYETLHPKDYASLNQIVQTATDQIFQLDSLSREFFSTIDQFLFEQREGRDIGPYAQQVRILDATRIQPAWTNVEMAWENALSTLKSLLESIEKIGHAITEIIEMSHDRLEEFEDLFGSITNTYRRLHEIDINVDGIVFQPRSDQIYWAEVKPDGRRITLHAAPLHIGQLMEKHLWFQKESITLTSATLTTAGEFNYLRDRLNAQDAEELALGSPFDYENSTLLYIPNNIPEPNDRRGHQRAVEQTLLHLCSATGGRTLVLFTSYAQLRRTSQAISSPLAKEGIIIYEQGEGASPHTLLENFRSTERAVLLGTRAFWEGVDVPGIALSVLVIVKLPFDVPSDPIIASRSETFEDPFYQYALPEAILRFRQGFGRLIRSRSDRGVVVIMDRRVLTKKYGQYFIDSLPACTKRVGPISEIPNHATRWLNI
ncbi:MAG: helicase C-terminal domain-containing protein [Anaerolineales bacterium]|jgi:DNA polymerase-3 subunit epsilon/ATP-dependent DNA helicase DinG